MASRNEHTGDTIISRVNTPEFDANFENIFRKKDVPTISDNSISSEYANDGRVHYVDKYKYANHLLKDDEMGFNVKSNIMQEPTSYLNNSTDS